MTRFPRISIAALAAVLPMFAQTGTPVPALSSFDAMITAAMAKYNVTGAALAVTHNGRLVLARGYGFADQENKIAVQPDSRFRIASLSKLITAVTVMHLVEQGKLSLDQPAFALLPDLQPPAGATVDPRLASITIRQLLTHSSGLHDNSDGDPMFLSAQITSLLNVPAPASTENI
ncbi:MAG: beta-lactamase family protein, partial [Acidobacteria bacterium]|nr:beta-lactamase family protein [Acidobacteriota bacterium]